MPADATQARSAVAREALLFAAAERVVALLKNAGVKDVIALKGASLVGVLWRPGERPMRDVDLLVAPSSFAAARAALLAAGFAALENAGRPFGARLHPAFAARSADGHLVDVHAHVAQRARWHLPHSRLLERAVPHVIGRARLWRPSDEDALVVAAVHLAKDLHEPPLAPATLEDIRRLVIRPGFSWHALAQRASEARAWVALATALTAAGVAASPALTDHPRWPARRLRLLADIAPTTGADTAAGAQRPSAGTSALIRALVTDEAWRFAASALGHLGLHATDRCAMALLTDNRARQLADDSARAAERARALWGRAWRSAEQPGARG